MINRENYLMLQRFFLYRHEVVQNTAETVHTYWEGLRHLLAWAGELHLSQAPAIRPTFPEYVSSHRADGRPGMLTPKYQGKVLGHAREFFKWATGNEDSMAAIRPAFIDTLKVRRSLQDSMLIKREYYTIEEIRKIAALQPRNIREQRDIAAVCFLFLSAMRVGAFVSLPCKAFDLQSRKVIQAPELGVKTKNRKAAITFLLSIEDLLAPLAAWDAVVRAAVGDDGHWYARLALDARSQYQPARPRNCATEVDRKNLFYHGLANLCARAGIKFKSPHKIRHGFGVFGVKKAKDMAQLKAISQNMMHSSIGITDGIYGKLAEDDLSDILSQIG